MGFVDNQLKAWLDAEMRDFEVVFKAFNGRLMKKMPIWMAISVVGMVALGFGVGYDRTDCCTSGIWTARYSG